MEAVKYIGRTALICYVAFAPFPWADRGSCSVPSEQQSLALQMPSADSVLLISPVPYTLHQNISEKFATIICIAQSCQALTIMTFPVL